MESLDHGDYNDCLSPHALFDCDIQSHLSPQKNKTESLNLNIIYKPAFIEPLNHASPAHPRAIQNIMAQITDIVLYYIHCAILVTVCLSFSDILHTSGSGKSTPNRLRNTHLSICHDNNANNVLNNDRTFDSAFFWS